MDISKNIIRLRESKGIKQKDMALALGIEPPNYSRLEKRGEKLTIEQLKSFASVIGVPFTDFLKIEDSETIHEEKLKRIQELEDRINDKNQIIKDLRFFLFKTEEIIESALDTLLFEIGQNNNLYLTSFDGVIFEGELTDEEFDFQTNKNPLPDVSFILTEDNSRKLAEIIKSNKDLCFLINEIIDFRLINKKQDFWTEHFSIKESRKNYFKLLPESVLVEEERLVKNLEVYERIFGKFPQKHTQK